MNWLDIILDHISEFGLKNITQLEKEYLNNYDTDLGYYMEVELNNRFNHYKSMYYYELQEAYWYEPKEWGTSLNEAVIKETRLNMLWDNMELEDSETFMKIHKVPSKYIDMGWTELPNRIKLKFQDYWEIYYNFQV
jgi:hypothetical protein